jgi:O-antigen/teichoic acid export membrane protein
MRAYAAAGAVGATNLGVAAFTLVNGVIMARMLGPGGRGALLAMMAFPTAAAALAGAFVQSALARRAAAPEPPRAHLNALALWAALPAAGAGAALAAAMVIAAGDRFDPGQRRAVLLYALLWTPVSLAILNLLALDLGAARWRRYNGMRLLLYPVILIGLGVAAWQGTRAPAAVLAILLAANAAVLLARVRVAARDGGFARVAAADVRALYREALPFLSASAAGAALVNADQLVAALVLPPVEAGFYAVAQRAAALMAPLASAAGVVAFSGAARGESTAVTPWERGVSLMLAGAALALAPVVFYAVPVLFGRDFLPARGPAVLALLAGLVGALTELREQRLEGGGRPLSMVPGRVAGALALTAVAVPAGVRYGPAGVVAGTVAAHSVRALVLGRVLARGARA